MMFKRRADVLREEYLKREARLWTWIVPGEVINTWRLRCVCGWEGPCLFSYEEDAQRAAMKHCESLVIVSREEEGPPKKRGKRDG